MRAAWFEDFGPASEALLVGELPDPEVGPGEVQVRIDTSGVNPSDVKKRAGAFPDLLKEGPVVPHSDGAGVITAVGKGVEASRVGERVWLYQAQHNRRLGTAAHVVVLDQRRAATLPDNVSVQVGACMGIPAMTAHRCVYADGPVSDQTVLVTGGAGRVGYYAIQWAKISGAKVIATASNDADRQACLDVGADHVVNHREGEWGLAVLDLNQGKKVDRVVDVEFGENLPNVLSCICTSGTIATYSSMVVPEPALPFRHMMFMDLTLRLVIVYDMPETAKTDAINDINHALKSDQLRHRIAREFSLDDIAGAHELIEQGNVRGCVVVNVSE